MKRGLFNGSIILLLIFVTLSCTKDQDDVTSILGTWVETDPVPERTTLYFATGNRLSLFDGDGNAEEYKYRIVDNTLFLTLAGDSEGTSELFFEQINRNTIKVENLYPSIPEAERSFIIFRRE